MFLVAHVGFYILTSERINNNGASPALLPLRQKPTTDAEDVSNVRNENDEQVDHEEQTHGDGDVPQPMESLLWEQQLLQGSADLRTRGSQVMSSSGRM